MPIYQVSSFCGPAAKGNQHLVCIDTEIDPVALSIRCAPFIVVNLTRDGGNVTARFYQSGKSILRCGSGYIAAAKVYFQQHPDETKASFHTAWKTINLQKFTTSGGNEASTQYAFDFQVLPQSTSKKKIDWTLAIDQAIQEVVYFGGETDYVALVLKSELAVKNCYLYWNFLRRFSTRAIILTAASQSKGYDYVLRYLAPRYSDFEDQATGSANAVIAAYWQKKIAKKKLSARQLSQRGGQCEISRHGNMQRVYAYSQIERQWSDSEIKLVKDELG